MSIFKKKELDILRSRLVEEAGGDIPDEAWNKVVEDVEKEYKKKLEETLPRAFWFSMFKAAENGDAIIMIDDKDLGVEIRKKRKELEEKK